MTRKTVLIVDDEEPILFGLHKVMHKDNETLDVLLARTGEIAREVIDAHDVDVLVTDVRMPGISGLELLCWAATSSPKTRGIIMTAFDTAGLECDAYRCGCLQIVQKPFDLHQMRQTVLTALDESSDLRGSLRSLSPADVVQMLCLGRRTNVLRVVDGDDGGVVHVRSGEVVHAVWNDLSGEDAFYQLVRADEGIFDTLPLPATGPTTIGRGWQHLLIEAMRLEDEERAGLSSRQPATPATDAHPAAPDGTAQPLPTSAPEEREPPPSAWDAAVSSSRQEPARDPSLPELIDQGFSHVQQRRYDEARQAWRRALKLDPGNRMLELNLRRLETMSKRGDTP